MWYSIICVNNKYVVTGEHVPSYEVTFGGSYNKEEMINKCNKLNDDAQTFNEIMKSLCF